MEGSTGGLFLNYLSLFESHRYLTNVATDDAVPTCFVNSVYLPSLMNSLNLSNRDLTAGCSSTGY